MRKSINFSENQGKEAVPRGGDVSQLDVRKRKVWPLFFDGGFPVLQVGVAHGAVEVDYRVLNLLKGLEI